MALSIGDLARATGTKVETIRYYERIGLLPAPARTAATTPSPRGSGRAPPSSPMCRGSVPSAAARRGPG